VPVNAIMRFRHYFSAQGREKHALAEYAGLGSGRADHCADCAGPCQKACPYGVPIQAMLALAHTTLTLA
jgi:predicted aldo/keto reductase-like oxidoreductase